MLEEKIREIIRQYIREEKITQKEFSVRMNVSPSTVTYWLTGKRNLSSVSYIRLVELVEMSKSLILKEVTANVLR